MADASLRHALAEVVAGWREGPASRSGTWHLPSTAAIVQARQRVGARLFQVLVQAVAGPIATRRSRGAFQGGLRLIALNGTTLDVADTLTNARAFGRPGTGRGAPGRAAPAALVRPGMLLLWDRNFHSHLMIQATLGRGADLMGRAKGNVILTPTGILSDGSFLAHVYPTPKHRRHDQDGQAVRVVEDALDATAGPGTGRYRLGHLAAG